MDIPATQFTYDFGDVLTAHLRNVRAGMPIEQAYDGTRILSQFEVDRERALNGGGVIQTQISATQAAKGDWYDGTETNINQDQSKEDTMAQTELRFLSEPIRVTRPEVLKANGDRALFSFMENKHNQGMRRIRLKIETALMEAATAAKAITSFRETCAIDPTIGVVDGIDRAVAGNEYWRNQTQVIGSLAGGGYENLEALSLACQKGGESDWDYGMCDSASFLLLKAYQRDYLSLRVDTVQSALGRRMVDVSIPVIEFEGKPIFWSPRIPAGLIYLVRKDAFDLAVHPAEEFKLIGPFPMENQQAHGMKWHLMWAGQLCWKLPSACGVGSGIAA